MSERSSKIITIIFIAVIFVIGAVTMKNLWISKNEVLKDIDYFSANSIIDSAVQEKVAAKTKWIDTNGLFQRTIGTTVVKDPGSTDVYKLDNGQIMYTLDKVDMSKYSQNLISLNETLSDSDTDLYYVQLPFKIQDSSHMPPGTFEYANVNSDELLAKLKDGGVDYLDLRDYMDGEYSDYYFDTDHHWKPTSALWAADIISEDVNKQYGYEIDSSKTDINNYNIKTYEDWFLGSMGKRTGQYYAGVDDFDVITPKFESNFDFYAESAGGKVSRTGSFEDVMFNYGLIEKRDYFGLNTYAGYIGGDFKLNTITNHDAPNDKKVLLLRDSYSCTLLPFLTVNFNEVTALDLRYYDDMSLEEYIDQYDPDLVMFAYNPSSFEDKQFKFK